MWNRTRHLFLDKQTTKALTFKVIAQWSNVRYLGCCKGNTWTFRSLDEVGGECLKECEHCVLLSSYKTPSYEIKNDYLKKSVSRFVINVRGSMRIFISLSVS